MIAYNKSARDRRRYWLCWLEGDDAFLLDPATGRTKTVTREQFRKDYREATDKTAAYNYVNGEDIYRKQGAYVRRAA